MSPINRITLFRIPKEEHVDAVLAVYETLQQDAVKDSKPYLVSATASRTLPDARSQGYTLCARTAFASLADMEYYDTQCAAHAHLKSVAMSKMEGGPPLTVIMEG